jgi:phage N-6-adenine-methyltransferase
VNASPYQFLPPLADDDFAELQADIAENGVQVPIVEDDQGNVIDGHHRIRACRELGITEWPVTVLGGLDEAAKRMTALRLNLHRRNLTREQRRELIAAAITEAPEKSDRAHAADLGVSHHTVAGVRATLEEDTEVGHESGVDAPGGQIAHVTHSIGSDGKAYRRGTTVRLPPVPPEMPIRAQGTGSSVKGSRLPPVPLESPNRAQGGATSSASPGRLPSLPLEAPVRLTPGDAGPPAVWPAVGSTTPANSTPETEAWRDGFNAGSAPPAGAPAEEPEPPATPAHAARRTQNRQSWATPQALFDLLDQEFHFTVDVCADPDNAKCRRFFTAAQDGLAQSWAGQVCFCNPPFGSKGRWVSKAYAAAKTTQATVVLLLPATPDTALWWDYCRHGEVRFLRGRLRFDDGAGGAPFPSALVIFRPGLRAADCRVLFWEEWSNG